MGIFYSVIPLIKVTSNQEGREWLDSHLVSYSLPERGRYPSLKEVRDTLHATQDVFIFDENIGSKAWSMTIEGLGDEWTCLQCNEYDGNELTPHPISFQKGWEEVIVRAVAALSRVCGAFLIDADCGSSIIITPDTSCDAAWFGDDFDEGAIYDPTEEDEANKLKIASSLEDDAADELGISA